MREREIAFNQVELSIFAYKLLSYTNNISCPNDYHIYDFKESLT